LVEPRKSSKGRASRRSISFQGNAIAKGDPRSGSVEGEVIDKWTSKTADQLAVWIDFPRVVRHIQAFDEKLRVIDFPSSLKGDDEGTSEEQDVRMRQQMRQMLILFAYRLGEKREFLDIEKNFLTSLGEEPSTHLKAFFDKYVSPNSKLISILKAINQAILAAPYISLKAKFTAMEVPVVDVNGSWLIETVFKQDEIVIIHSKKAKSTHEGPEDEFSFKWHIALIFDKSMSSIKDVRLSMSDLEMNKMLKDKIKKKLQNIKDHELFL